MPVEFWYTLPLYILAFIAFFMMAVYGALYIPWFHENDYHLVAFATTFAVVGTLLFSYVV